MQLVAFTEKAIMENFNSTVFLRISLLTHSLCEKCPNVEFFFWPVFSCIRTEYEDLRSEVFSPNTGKDGPETFHAVISGQYSYFPEHFIFWGYEMETVVMNLLTISDQCSNFISPENTRKPKVFWYSQSV